MSRAPVPDTPPARIDELLANLAERSRAWVRVGLRERVDFLSACLAGASRVAEEWVRRSCEAQGIEPGSRLEGEQWLSGPAVSLRCLRLSAESLRQRAAPLPPALERRHDRWIARVAPAGRQEALLYRGLQAEVWMQPGQPPSQGAIYRAKQEGDRPSGGVAVVLGAGNVSGIAPRDLIHRLFVEDEVVVLKMHPVNQYLGPLLAEAFATLVEAGYLAIVYGGAETGRHLCRHPLVDSVHLTGSWRTHDAIVWGDDEAERQRRKTAGEPAIDKRVTSELGCVSPVIVVPGDWSDAELDHQARHVAGMVVHNAGFNCNAAKLLVTAADWPLRRAFLDRLRAVLAVTPPRPAWYPGAEQRWERMLAAYPDADIPAGPAPAGHLPWALAAGVPAEPGQRALREEAFCGFFAETPLPLGEPADFLAAAVDLCNEHVWGSLSCMLVVDPRTAARLGPALEQAVADLRYGGVAINSWSGYLFGLASPSWGAYPGNTLDDIGSGIGTVGNTYLFDHPEKSVLRAPFVAWPKPLWFPDHSTLRQVGRQLARFEAAPSWRRLPALAAAAARA